MMKSMLMAVLTLGTACFLSAGPSMAQEEGTSFCVGGPSGKYAEVGKGLMSEAGIRGSLVTTAGSLEELKNIRDKRCGVAIVQSDSLTVFQKSAGSVDVERILPLYKEFAHLVCNKDRGPESVKDLEDSPEKFTVLLGKPGSGSAVTWANWVLEDPDYGKVRTQNLEGTRAINRIIDGREAQCILFVAGLGSKTMTEIDKVSSGKLRLVPVNDWDFNDSVDPDGNSVYEFTKIPGGTYPNLQEGVFSTSVETLSLDAVMISTPDWADENSDSFEALSKAAQNYVAQH